MLTGSDPAGPLGADDVARRLAPLLDFRHALLAVSGGPDSLCLLHAAARWREGRADGPVLSVATVDHGLRAASTDEARIVADAAARLGLSHAVLPWSGPKPTAGLQAKARDERYRLLAAHAHTVGADVLLTAHHADDQAETVLLRLVRGSGLHGLRGMEVLRERGPGLHHLRPFLDLPKERLVATLVAEGTPFVRDPSNEDPRFARSRARALAPLLAAEGLDRGRLLTLAARARRADDALDRRAAVVLAALAIPVGMGEAKVGAGLLTEPAEIVLRVLLRMIEDLPRGEGGTARPLRLERLEALTDDLIQAAGAKMTLRRSAAGCVVTLDRHGAVTISREALRRRGRKARDS